MAAVTFELGTKTQTFHDKFKTVLVQLKQAGLSDFDWLRDVIMTTLEDDSRARVTDPRLDLNVYNPLLVEENMAAASRLLDTCLVQRKEIYQLEAQAITTGLDILTTSTTLERNYELAQLGLAADIRQAIDAEGKLAVNLDRPVPQKHEIPVKLLFPVVAATTLKAEKPAYSLPDVDVASDHPLLSEVAIDNAIKIDRLESALREKQEAMRAALHERLALHNRTGSALNYGERVRFMRKVYLDNLGLAYQRIHAAWRGLALVYGVKRAKPTIAEKASILEGFVEWLRTAMSAAEVSDRREYTVERSFKLTLSEHPAANGSYHVTFSPSRDSFNLFSSGEFSYAGSEAEPDALRVVGIEVALFSTGKAEHADFRAALAGLTDKPQLATAFSLASERRQRLLEQLTAEMVIVPPPSHTRVGDEALSHQPLPMRLDHVPFWAAGSTRPPLAPALDNGFVNASPLGTWRLRVSSEIHLRWIRGGTKSLDVLYGEAGLAAALADLGIYLKLRVAVRPSARTMAAAGQT